MQNLSCHLTEHIFARSEECFRRAEAARNAVSDIAGFEAYVEKAKRQFARCIGELPYDRELPLEARTTAAFEDDGLTIENVLFVSRPGVYISANVYKRTALKGPTGGVLLLMGHSANGKCYATYQRAARILAKAGLFVLAVDPTGQGERSNYAEDGQPKIRPGVPDHNYAGDPCVLAGTSIIKYFMADAMRAVDYMISRPEVDPLRIGATGISGGGTQTSYMMVCDERIRAAAPGCSLTVRRAYLRTGIEQDAEKIWIGGTLEGFDYHELVTCFCPKPLLILGCDHDYVPLDGTVECYLTGKRFWKLLGREKDIGIIVDHSPHGFTEPLARAAAEFFARTLNEETVRPAPADYEPLPDERLQCTPTGQTSALPGAKSLFDENAAEFERMAAHRDTAETVWDGLCEAIESPRFRKPEEPRPVRVEAEGPVINGIVSESYIWNTQKDIRCFGQLWRKAGADRAALCLWKDGTLAAAEHADVIRRLLERGSVFVCDLSGSGRCAPDDKIVKTGICRILPTLSRLNKDLLFMGDSLFALRVYDLSRTLRMLASDLGFAGTALYAEGVDTLTARVLNRTEGVGLLHTDDASARSSVTEKYYDTNGIEFITHPGIAYIL